MLEWHNPDKALNLRIDYHFVASVISYCHPSISSQPLMVIPPQGMDRDASIQHNITACSI